MINHSCIDFTVGVYSHPLIYVHVISYPWPNLSDILANINL